MDHHPSTNQARAQPPPLALSAVASRTLALTVDVFEASPSAMPSIGASRTTWLEKMANLPKNSSGDMSMACINVVIDMAVFVTCPEPILSWFGRNALWPS